MVQRVQYLLVDDLDGGEADETVSFALDGVSYEIDLSETNAENMRESLAEWVNSARRVSGRASRGRGGRSRQPSTAKVDLSAVRAWARDNGYQVSDRGRVSADILAAFDAAQ
jgi:hypothetical protein